MFCTQSSGLMLQRDDHQSGSASQAVRTWSASAQQAASLASRSPDSVTEQKPLGSLYFSRLARA